MSKLLRDISCRHPSVECKHNELRALSPIVLSPRTAATSLLLWLSLACSERRSETASASLSASELAPVIVPENPASGTTANQEPSQISLGVSRSLAATTWDTLWQKRGTFDDTLLLQPLQLHAQGSIVFVADYGKKNVQAFDAETGEKLWAAGRPGSGPREFYRMTLFSESDHILGVADDANRRISFVSRRGEIERETSVPLPSGQNGVCRLGASYFVAGHRDRRARLLKWTKGTDSLELLQPEWLSYLDTMHHIIGQFSVGRVDESQCVIQNVVGPLDLLIFDSMLALTKRVTPREQLRVARVDSGLNNGRLALSIASGSGYGWGHPATADRSLFVTFRGTTAARGRIIDEFRLPDFAYVGTHVAPHDLRGLAGADDRLTLLMEDTAGYYVLTQLRRRQDHPD